MRLRVWNGNIQWGERRYYISLITDSISTTQVKTIPLPLPMILMGQDNPT